MWMKDQCFILYVQFLVFGFDVNRQNPRKVRRLFPLLPSLSLPMWKYKDDSEVR